MRTNLKIALKTAWVNRWMGGAIAAIGVMGLVSCAGGSSTGSSTGSSPGSPPAISQAAGSPTVVTLTQTGCQFVETEAKDYGFKTEKKADCETVNAQTGAERQSQLKPLKLKAGDYLFRVTNRDVPYELGFYLRGAGLNQVRLPKVSGGGQTQGVAQEYRVSLVPGEYVFSCPLNPTPDYPLIVE